MSHQLRIYGLASDGVAPAATPTTLPTAPAPDARVLALERYLAGSPLAGQGSEFVAAADHHGVDWRLMPAIAMHESTLGRYGCAQSTHNPFGLSAGVAPGGGIICRWFSTWTDAIWEATRTFADYGVDLETGLCWWVSGPRGVCDRGYVMRVGRTMAGIGW